MKKSLYLIILFLFLALCCKVFGQNTAYPFEVKITGSGSGNLVLIPGFACSGEVWKETLTSFEKKYTCYTLTMAGFAGAKANSNSSFANWAEQIAAFIKVSKIEKPIIIGHSMGGGLAMRIAADYPELLKGIVVVDALPCLQALFNPMFKSNPENNCSEMINQLGKLSEEEFKQMQLKSIPQLLSDTLKRDLVISWSLKSDRKTFAGMYCDFSNTDLRNTINTITCPALILLEAPFKEYAPAMTKQYSNLKTADIRYANKGLHFIMYDDKEWYLTQLTEFVHAHAR